MCQRDSIRHNINFSRHYVTPLNLKCKLFYISVSPRVQTSCNGWYKPVLCYHLSSGGYQTNHAGSDNRHLIQSCIGHPTAINFESLFPDHTYFFSIWMAFSNKAHNSAYMFLNRFKSSHNILSANMVRKQ